MIRFRCVLEQILESLSYYQGTVSHQIFLKVMRKRDPVNILMTGTAEKEEPFLRVGTFGGDASGNREDTMEDEVRERELPVTPLTSPPKQGFDCLLPNTGGSEKTHLQKSNRNHAGNTFPSSLPWKWYAGSPSLLRSCLPDQVI